MKNIMICFGFLLLFVSSSYSAEPLVLFENKMPLTLSIDSIPESIGRTEVVTVNYDWVNWSKSEFEQKQAAAGKITYSVVQAKFCGRRHIYGGKVKQKTFDSGVLKRGVSSYVDDKGGYGIGKGWFSVSVYCSYKGKDGKRHKGKIGHVQVNVNFVRP